MILVQGISAQEYTRVSVCLRERERERMDSWAINQAFSWAKASQEWKWKRWRPQRVVEDRPPRIAGILHPFMAHLPAALFSSHVLWDTLFFFLLLPLSISSRSSVHSRAEHVLTFELPVIGLFSIPNERRFKFLLLHMHEQEHSVQSVVHTSTVYLVIYPLP